MNNLTDLKLPKPFNYYDLFKILAIFTMLIDHIGLFFFQSSPLFRVIGRVSVPIWMFLLGYNTSNKITTRLIKGAFLVQVFFTIFMQKVICLNILFSIILFRLVRAGINPTINLVVLVLLHPMLVNFIEYGSAIFLFALSGEMKRKGQAYMLLLIPSCIIYIILQQYTFKFSTDHLAIFCVLLALASSLIYMYEPFGKTGFYSNLAKILSRNSLELYVLHIILFTIMVSA